MIENTTLALGWGGRRRLGAIVGLQRAVLVLGLRGAY